MTTDINDAARARMRRLLKAMGMSQAELARTIEEVTGLRVRYGRVNDQCRNNSRAPVDPLLLFAAVMLHHQVKVKETALAALADALGGPRPLRARAAGEVGPAARELRELFLELLPYLDDGPVLDRARRQVEVMRDQILPDAAPDAEVEDA